MVCCTRCGAEAESLFTGYKLAKCKECKGTIDKYVEYDSVIIMIDLILISKGAQRHVIYNTQFEHYIKIFVVLAMLETYGLWRRESFTNIMINLYCHYYSSTLASYPSHLHREADSCHNIANYCVHWTHQDRWDPRDIFLWEKNFYIHFTSVVIGVAVFILTTQSLMWVCSFFTTIHTVGIRTSLKAFSLSNVGQLLSVPALVWGSGGDSGAPVLQATLVAMYGYVVLLVLLTVVYGCPRTITAGIILISHYMKLIATFNVVPLLKDLVS